MSILKNFFGWITGRHPKYIPVERFEIISMQTAQLLKSIQNAFEKDYQQNETNREVVYHAEPSLLPVYREVNQDDKFWIFNFASVDYYTKANVFAFYAGSYLETWRCEPTATIVNETLMNITVCLLYNEKNKSFSYCFSGEPKRYYMLKEIAAEYVNRFYIRIQNEETVKWDKLIHKCL